jgi:hypothetical protein
MSKKVLVVLGAIVALMLGGCASDGDYGGNSSKSRGSSGGHSH